MDLPSCLVGNSLDHGVRLEKSASSGYSFFFSPICSSNVEVSGKMSSRILFLCVYFFPPFVHTEVIDSHP